MADRRAEQLFEELCRETTEPQLALLLVVAQPDDEVLSASRVLQRFGLSVRIAYVTDGAPRGPRYFAEVGLQSRGAYRDARRDEALAALSFVGVSPYRMYDLGEVDQEASLHMPRIAQSLAEICSAFAPDAVPRRRFVGSLKRAALRRALARARCLVVPSLVAETSSLVAMEALSCGTPVIARDIGALAEIVEHGKTGLLFDTPAEMRDAVVRIRSIDRRACRVAALERFDQSHMTRSYVDLYTALAEGRAFSRAGALGAHAP